MSFLDRLASFADANAFRGKGPLSVALVLNDQVKARLANDDNIFPLDPDSFLTPQQGQVYGLGGGAVKRVLKRHNIERVLSTEGGRTSRGSIENMRAYIAFLNASRVQGDLDLEAAEHFWVSRVEEFFASKPFTLRLDASLAIRAVVRDLFAQAAHRQRENSGTMVVGTLMQHLVGAKLDVVLGPDSNIEHHCANQSDQKAGRTGDFDIGDVSIHVTTAPSEALIGKCRANIDAARKPIIVSTRDGVLWADKIALDAGISQFIEIIEIEQFMASNVHELGRFNAEGRRDTVAAIVSRYNMIVGEVETDPSLVIETAPGR